MKIQECSSCGSKDLYKNDGYYICRYCDTKHLITKDDLAPRSSSISLNEDVARLLQKCKDDPANAERYAKLVLEMDANNVEAKEYLKKESNSGGCYVATAVYGSYDCPEVWTLRRYRDNNLAKHWFGRAFVRVYYAVSPTLVKWLGDTKWFKAVWRSRLDKMVKSLQEKGVENTPYQDKKW